MLSPFSLFHSLSCFYLLQITLLVLLHCPGSQQYDPNWVSLDSRPLPEWYDRAKFGIFLHWGVYSVPSYLSEWFWFAWKAEHDPLAVEFMRRNYPPNFQYADFAPSFTAELFDPSKWAEIFQAAGARYVVLTSKHHEGFTLWPSNHSFNWNAMHVGPHRDLVGELASAIRALPPFDLTDYEGVTSQSDQEACSDGRASNRLSSASRQYSDNSKNHNHTSKSDFKNSHIRESENRIRFGLYHSLFEWFNPLYMWDVTHLYLTQAYVREKVIPALHELVERYEPAVLWSDGDGGPDVYWNSTEFLAWLFTYAPASVRDSVVVNDRWGFGTNCKHGSFYTCGDRFLPGHLVAHKWEACITLDRSSWGYRRDMQATDVLSLSEILSILTSVVACNGNLLLNVGPTSDGRIVPIFEERLRELGCWLRLNGDAIYDTVPWRYQNDSIRPGVWFTKSNNIFIRSKQPAESKAATTPSIYALVLEWDLPSSFVSTPNTDPAVRIELGVPEPSDMSEAFLLAGRASRSAQKTLATRIPLQISRRTGGGVVIQIPSSVLEMMARDRSTWSCELALAIELTNLSNA